MNITDILNLAAHAINAIGAVIWPASGIPLAAEQGILAISKILESVTAAESGAATPKEALAQIDKVLAGLAANDAAADAAAEAKP